MTYRGHRIKIVRTGIFQCRVEYVDMWTHLHRSERQFFVRTSTLELENPTANLELPDESL